MFKLVYVRASLSVVGAEKSSPPEKSRFIQVFILSIPQIEHYKLLLSRDNTSTGNNKNSQEFLKF